VNGPVFTPGVKAVSADAEQAAVRQGHPARVALGAVNGGALMERAVGPEQTVPDEDGSTGEGDRPAVGCAGISVGAARVVSVLSVSVLSVSVLSVTWEAH
jgi:hypothetical protein